MNEGDSCRFDKMRCEWQEVCLCSLRGGGVRVGPKAGVLGSKKLLRQEAGEFASVEERVVPTVLFSFLWVGSWFSSYWREIVLPLLLLPCPHPVSPVDPPDPSLHCPISPHFIALLNADNW